MFLLFNVVLRVGVTEIRMYRSGCFFSLMLFRVSVLQIRMWMFLLFNVVSRVGVTDPDVDVSSLSCCFTCWCYRSGCRCSFSFDVVSCVGVTDPDVDVSSRYVVSRVGVTDPDVCFFSLMLFHVSVLQIRMWMFLLFYVVSRVGVTDPDVDVSSHYFVLRVGVTVPDDDVSSL